MARAYIVRHIPEQHEILEEVELVDRRLPPPKPEVITKYVQVSTPVLDRSAAVHYFFGGFCVGLFLCFVGLLIAWFSIR